MNQERWTLFLTVLAIVVANLAILGFLVQGQDNRAIAFVILTLIAPLALLMSDISVLCSRYEGNPMSVQEAMASGLPGVATAVGGVPELVVEGVTGLLVHPDDEPALVEALNALICHPDLRLQMAHQARQRAREHFDIRQTVRAYEQLYTQILDK